MRSGWPGPRVAAGLVACMLAGLASAAVPQESRGWLGVFMDDAVDGGVQFVAVVPGGPAERAGLLAGDVLVRVGQDAVVDVEALHPILERSAAGERLSLVVLRGQQRVVREVELGRRDATRWKRLALTPPPAPPALAASPPPPVPPLPEAPGGTSRGLEAAGLGPSLREHYGAPATAGVLITRIAPELAATGPGLAVGDVVVALDGQPLSDPAVLERALARAAAEGQPVTADRVRERSLERVVLRLPGEQARAPRAALAGLPRLAADARASAIAREIARLERRIDELRLELQGLDPAGGRAADQP